MVDDGVWMWMWLMCLIKDDSDLRLLKRDIEISPKEKVRTSLEHVEE